MKKIGIFSIIILLVAATTVFAQTSKGGIELVNPDIIEFFEELYSEEEANWHKGHIQQPYCYITAVVEDVVRVNGTKYPGLWPTQVIEKKSFTVGEKVTTFWVINVPKGQKELMGLKDKKFTVRIEWLHNGSMQVEKVYDIKPSFNYRMYTYKNFINAGEWTFNCYVNGELCFTEKFIAK